MSNGTIDRRKAPGPLSVMASSGIVLFELLLCASLWGPQPLGWLWVGSQAKFVTGSLSTGLGVAFVGSVLSIVATVWIAHHLDRWRRAHLTAGPGRPIALETMFVVGAMISLIAFSFWFFILAGPGSSLAPRV